MLNPNEITNAVNLQQRSYQLLKWMADAIGKGFILFDSAHDFSSFPEAAEAWITVHYMNIPSNARPDRDKLSEFCAFFSTYLQNSFILDRNPGKQLYSPVGRCFCPFCAWLAEAPSLKTIKPTSSDKRRARMLRVAVVQQIAAEHDAFFSDNDVNAIVDDIDLKAMTSLVAYAEDLLLRTKGIANGSRSACVVAWFRMELRGFTKKAILNCRRSLFLRKLRNWTKSFCGRRRARVQSERYQIKVLQSMIPPAHLHLY